MAINPLHDIVAERKREQRTIFGGNDPLTVERLKTILHYDPAVGVFYNRYTRHSWAKAGAPSGTIEKRRGYVMISLDRLHYPAHRLAWFYVHSKWPAGVVDHINGNPSDNRIENLRDCSQSDNVFNRRRGHLTPSGVRGVRFRANGWEASITKNNQHIFLGRFVTFAEAAAARQGAERCLFEAIPSVGEPPSECAQEQIFLTARPPLPPLDAEALRKIVSYNPLTGRFLWLKRTGNAGRFAGLEPSAVVQSDGHLRTKVHSRSYLAHRLAWLYMTGEWPKGDVHHVNNDPADNRWENLRDVTKSQNAMARRRWGSLTLPKGVYRNGQRFSASIQKEGKVTYLGIFDTPSEAHAAYCTAAAELHGEFARTE